MCHERLAGASPANHVDVMGIMFVAIWIAHRRERRALKLTADETSNTAAPV